jgi:hypothetical protein
MEGAVAVCEAVDISPAIWAAAIWRPVGPIPQAPPGKAALRPLTTLPPHGRIQYHACVKGYIPYLQPLFHTQSSTALDQSSVGPRKVYFRVRERLLGAHARQGVAPWVRDRGRIIVNW